MLAIGRRINLYEYRCREEVAPTNSRSQVASKVKRVGPLIPDSKKEVRRAFDGPVGEQVRDRVGEDKPEASPARNRSDRQRVVSICSRGELFGAADVAQSGLGV